MNTNHVRLSSRRGRSRDVMRAVTSKYNKNVVRGSRDSYTIMRNLYFYPLPHCVRTTDNIDKKYIIMVIYCILNAVKFEVYLGLLIAALCADGDRVA